MINKISQAWSKIRLKDPNYQFLFAPPVDEDVVCFDCETTGLDTKHDQIISLSAIKIRGQQILTSQSLNLRFKQQADINPQSIVVHQIRNMDLQQAYEPQLAIKKFVEFIGSRPLVGYYLEFDVAMVNQLIKPWLGIHLPNRHIDISQLYHKLYYQDWLQPDHQVFDLSFKTMLEKLNVPLLGQHDAFNDALMTAMIYVKLQTLIQAKN